MNLLQTVSYTGRKFTYQAENRNFSGFFFNRKSQTVPMQKTLALISAVWICFREAKAEGSTKSLLHSREAETFQTAYGWVTGSITQNNFIQKQNQSWQTRNKLEWNMDELPKHPSIETQLFGCDCANSIEHTGRHREFFIVWCLKDWFLLGPKRHWSRRLCHSTIDFQHETLKDEAVTPLLRPALQNAALIQG